MGFIKGGVGKKKTIQAGFILFILFWGVFNVNAAPSLNQVDELEAFLDGVLSSQFDEHKIPGATLAVVKDGEIILTKGYGFSDLKERKPVNPERTLFRPGSISKLFTWTAVMQMVEQEKVDLDADINDYLDIKIPEGFSGTGKEPAPITLRHLLTHTPGFEDVGEGLFVIGEENLKTLDDYLEIFKPARVFPPGEVLAYSNYGTALAGYIVERVSGQPFYEYVEENIFQPLGMENSTFRQPLPEDMSRDLAGTYKYRGGEYYRGDFEFISAYPAGSLSTTASDMAKFMIAHLEGERLEEKGILQAKTAEKMHQTQFRNHPEVPGMAFGFIETEVNGEKVLNHNGATLLFFSGLYLLPEHDVGFYVSYSGGTGMEMEKLFQSFMDRFYPSEYTEAPETDAKARERALSYSGEYHSSRSNFTSFEKILSILERVSVNVTEEDNLQINFAGEQVRLHEVEPGLYQNFNTEGTQLIKTAGFQTGPGGETLLVPGGPTIYTRVLWYESSAILGTLTVLTLALTLIALIGWGKAFIRRRLRGEKSRDSRDAKIARCIAAVFGILTLLLLVGFLGTFSSIDPAYGVPEIVFGEVPAWFPLLFSLSFLLAPLALVMLGFAVLSWRNKYWSLSSRIYFSLYTISALGFMWVLFYTKLL